MWNPFCKSQQPSSAELTQINSKLNTIMAALDDLKAQVARSITVEQSAITLIQGSKPNWTQQSPQTIRRRSLI
jgi:hypothetical protein